MRSASRSPTSQLITLRPVGMTMSSSTLPPINRPMTAFPISKNQTKQGRRLSCSLELFSRLRLLHLDHKVEKYSLYVLEPMGHSSRYDDDIVFRKRLRLTAVNS